MIFNLAGGGGGGLNFKIIGSTTQPTSPSENTIWVNTSTAITGYVFDVTQPTGSEGLLWFSTGTSCAAPFNALKKNTIQIYPTGVKQYISGSWVDVSAKTYQGGAWIDWAVYLFNNGAVDGVSWSGTPGATSATVTTSGAALKMDCPDYSSETNYVAYLKQSNSHPTNGATKLKIHFTRLEVANGNSSNYPLSISINGGSSYVKSYNNLSLSDLTDNTLALDVSAVSAVTLWFKSHLWDSLNSSCYLTIDKIWLE